MQQNICKVNEEKFMKTREINISFGVYEKNSGSVNVKNCKTKKTTVLTVHKEGKQSEKPPDRRKCKKSSVDK